MDGIRQKAERCFLDWLDGLPKDDQAYIQGMSSQSKAALVEAIAEAILQTIAPDVKGGENG